MVAANGGVLGRATILLRALAAPWVGAGVLLEVPSAAPIVLARVAGALAGERRLRTWASLRVRGSVHGDRIGLWMPDGYRNSFRPVLVVTVRPLGPRSCVLVGRTRMFRFTQIFMTVWMTFAMVGAAAGTYAAITTGDAVLLVVLLFPVFGLALVAFGWRWAAAQSEGLSDWLAGTCEAAATPAGA